MNIVWSYLDKRSAAVNALKDYDSMQFILEHTDEDIAAVRDRMIGLGSPALSDMPKGPGNPAAAENRLAGAIDEIDVLKERYRQAVEYMSWFRPAWDVLSEDERFVLKTFFWKTDDGDTDPIATICAYFSIERNSVYKKKNRALEHLALLLYGK